jgi:hypothetical protein
LNFRDRFERVSRATGFGNRARSFGNRARSFGDRAGRRKWLFDGFGRIGVIPPHARPLAGGT